MNRIKLMLITNSPEVAQFAQSCGVERIFLDLEIIGKYERQGHLDTVISNHTLEDVSKIRKVLNKSELLVRINPVHDNTEYEIERVLSAGADIVMLPMFTSVSEVNFVSELIDHRCQFIPLVETAKAANCIQDVANVKGVTEVYIGLNDLHRDLGMSFMFEPLATGLLSELVYKLKQSGKPFGFGGIACIGQGELPAELILSEHIRLNSSSVILARAFHKRAKNIEDLRDANFEFNISQLRTEEEKLRGESSCVIDIYHEQLISTINKVVGKNFEKNI
ncbi:aldolase/citrate lyase family protein [Shewanella khirikhana]|uniref:HpcH/HpaI aldolase/citrate lyase family protein n=1 Tax=Shewanella khirikhana TaxID=1965282 RepID=A0ABN5TV71_9GAMM|nr:aldolase/citrate lyase family protein [Shewanella khirikhana]AZQ11102.1 HpcH/HpaI aldolase/citrate lyase family protein [Shewanella khirikhana]